MPNPKRPGPVPAAWSVRVMEERRKNSGPGFDARGCPRVALTCASKRCRRLFWTSRPDVARFCSDRCREWESTRPGTHGHAQRLRDRKHVRTAVLGRTCKWCKATDAEVEFATINGQECSTCNRGLFDDRGAACGKCKGPRASHGFCVRCDKRPPHLIELIWIDEATERERRIWIPLKAQYFHAPGNLRRRGRGPAAGLPPITEAQRVGAICSGQLVLIVPTAMWLKRRM